MVIIKIKIIQFFRYEFNYIKTLINPKFYNYKKIYSLKAFINNNLDNIEIIMVIL